MRREVKAAVIFFKRLAVARGKLDLVKADLFAEKLQQVMSDKYTGHWYPECPTKGQAYRCIRINNQSPPDDMLLKACKQSDIPYSSLGLPPEITVWVDPLEVSVRSGENGRPFTIARFSPNEEQGDPIDESSNVDTSDYHSETSSDCSSIVSSDTEEDPKDGEAKDKQAKPGPAIDKEAVKGATYTIAMVPRVRTRPVDGQPKVKVVRPMVIPPTAEEPPAGASHSPPQ
uniref:Si:dkey-79d12.5 n=1 Tax=Salarias fasciatus TaxID=181472 RepID=A0A672HWH6_SALFA